MTTRSLLPSTINPPPPPPPIEAQVNLTSITVMWSHTAEEIGTSTHSYTYQEHVLVVVGMCQLALLPSTLSMSSMSSVPYTVTLAASNGGGNSFPACVMVNTSSAGEVDDLHCKMADSLPFSPQQLPLLPLAASLK